MRAPRRLRVLVAAAIAASAGVATIVNAPPAAAAMTQRWDRQIAGARFHWSSPAVADVDGNGTNEVVATGLNGSVYVIEGDSSVRWEAKVGAAIASSAAVGDVDGDGANEVVTGYGDLDLSPRDGGIAVINHDGQIRCKFETNPQYGPRAVFNSPAIGDVDGDLRNDIVFGSFDHRVYVVNGNCGLMAFFDNTDTVWSAPALRDVDGDREQEIFIGADASASSVGLAHSGGYYRSLEFNGTGTLAQRWVRLSSETFQTGSAIADLNGDGRMEVVTGSGSDYCRNQGGRCADSNRLWVFDAATGGDVAGWTDRRLDAGHWMFLGAPAVGEVDGDGRLDVVAVGTRNGGGQVRAFLGNGQSWTFNSSDEVIGSPVIVDTTGGGAPEVVISAQAQVFVLDGPSGGIVQRGLAAGDRSQGLVHKSAAAAGVLAGAWTVVTTSFDPAAGAGNRGHVTAFTIPGPSSAPWPMHQKNARRLGNDPTDATPCKSGYWLVAADGGIFSFGSQAPFFGSTGAIRLNQPIVGMTSPPARQGYWFVARDGGIFTFGSLPFHGSMGGTPLNQPIVGMAARPQGDGYWLVAADGGIFAFGNAAFHGSMGGTPLNQPIVGMASTPTGRGYWLVARDGGIFAFGDATFFGSTGDIRLNQPIVGMSSSPSGRGYWFVAADGGIFTFGDAPFLGSIGNLRLNRPVVGMRATPDGRGYWFVATDGGIFSFGDAEFCGSRGGRPLNLPVIGMG